MKKNQTKKSLWDDEDDPQTLYEAQVARGPCECRPGTIMDVNTVCDTCGKNAWAEDARKAGTAL